MPQNYDYASGDRNLGEESTRDLEALSKHIEKHWGDGMVWHEIYSEYVHVDVHLCKATSNRPYQVLVTTGMSDRPMVAPIERAGCEYCELMMALPASWPMDETSFKEERHYWPVRHLKISARFPHTVETWIWYGHTLGNGNELTPVVPETPFVGFALSIPTLCPETAWKLQVREGKKVHFFALIPLYEAELKFAWEHGTKSLFEKLDAAGVNEIVDVTRPCVITGKRPVTAGAAAEKLTDRIRKWFGK